MTTQIHVEPADHNTDLCELLGKYGSDKGNATGTARHDYSRYYVAIFRPIRETTKRVFELGIFGGASLRAWRDYFPNATVMGADIDMGNVAAMKGEPRIIAKQCDETIAGQVSWLWDGQDEFDIMIDDALHTLEDNVRFFEWSNHMLRKGGIYIIEDVPEHQLREATQWAIAQRDLGWAAHVLVSHREGVPDNNLIVLRAP